MKSKLLIPWHEKSSQFMYNVRGIVLSTAEMSMSPRIGKLHK